MEFSSNSSPLDQRQRHPVTFSSDGKYLLFTNTEGLVRFDTESYRQRDFSCDTRASSSTEALLVSPDQRQIATLSHDKVIQLWDYETGEPLCALRNPGQKVRSIAFSSGGQYLAAGDVNGSVTIWHLRDSKVVATFVGHAAPVTSLAVAANGEYIVSGGEDNTLKFWRLGAILPPEEQASGPAAAIARCDSDDYTDDAQQREDFGITKIAFSPGGRSRAYGHANGSVLIVAEEPGKDAPSRPRLVRLTGHGGPITDLAYSNWDTLISGSKDETVRVWSRHEDLWGLETTLRSFAAIVTAVAASPAHRETVASGGGDGSITLWHIASSKPCATFRKHSSRVTGLAFSADGKVLLSGSSDRTVRLWSVESRRLIAAIECRAAISCLACSEEGTYFATGDVSGDVRVWSLKTRKSLALFGAHTKAIGFLRFSKNGKYLASVDEHRVACLWNADRDEKIDTFVVPDEGSRLAFSDDGKRILFGGVENRNVHVRCAAKKRQTAKPSPQAVVTAFSADRQLLAVDGETTEVCIWRLETHSVERVLVGHTRPVTALAFNATSALLASGGDDNEIIVWSRADWSLLRRLAGHEDTIECLSFRDHENRLVSRSDDSVLKVWSLSTFAEERDPDGRYWEELELQCEQSRVQFAQSQKDGREKETCRIGFWLRK